MDQYREALVSLARRAIIGMPFLIVGFVFLLRTDGCSRGEALIRGLLGCSAIIVSAIILAFPLARLIAEPAGNLFYSRKRLSRPLPMHSMVEAKRKRGEYGEAMMDYEKMVQEYPQEVKAYIAMIDIAIVDMKSGEKADGILAQGIATLSRDEDREILTRMHTAIRSRLKS